MASEEGVPAMLSGSSEKTIELLRDSERKIDEYIGLLRTAEKAKMEAELAQGAAADTAATALRVKEEAVNARDAAVKEAAELRTQLEAAKAEHESVAAQASMLNASCTEMRGRVEGLEEAKTVLEQDKQVLMADVTRLKLAAADSAVSAELEQKLKDANTKIDEQQQRISELEGESKKTGTDEDDKAKHLLGVCSQLRSQLADLQFERDGLAEEKTSLLADVARMKLAEVEGDADSKEKELAALSEEKLEAQEATKKLALELEVARTQIKHLEGEHAKLKDQSAGSMDKLQSELMSLQEALRKAPFEAEKARAESREVVSKMELELAATRAKASTLEARCESHAAEVATAAAKLEEATARAATFEEQLTAAALQHNDAAVKLQTELTAMTARAEHAERVAVPSPAVEPASAPLSPSPALEAEVVELRTALAAASQRSDALQARLTTLEMRAEKHAATASYLEELNGRLEQENERLERENERLTLSATSSAPAPAAPAVPAAAPAPAVVASEPAPEPAASAVSSSASSAPPPYPGSDSVGEAKVDSSAAPAPASPVSAAEKRQVSMAFLEAQGFSRPQMLAALRNLQHLVDMGFDEADARIALVAMRGKRLEQIVEYMMSR